MFSRIVDTFEPAAQKDEVTNERASEAQCSTTFEHIVPVSNVVIPASLIGFKAFRNGLVAFGGFEYEIGKEYSCVGEMRFCENGFHFCAHPLDVDEWYRPGPDTEYAIVEILGEIQHDPADLTQSVTDRIRVLKQISRDELIECAPYAPIRVRAAIGRVSKSDRDILNRFTADQRVGRYRWMINDSSYYYRNGMYHLDDDTLPKEFESAEKAWHKRLGKYVSTYDENKIDRSVEYWKYLE